jgi:hypothetical protein
MLSDPRARQRVLLEKHPALKKAFDRQLGYGRVFTESRGLLAVLAQMIRRGVVALPFARLLALRSVPGRRRAEVMRRKAIGMRERA